ncbi:MAG TPA: methyltransferase domain-containing protein [Candidatus Acidoferrum sp.]|nr:methyltransferase domain-containing protein [Candidatus Acidoferrum sp.]
MIAARNIEYLSPPAQVSMADQWFEIASLDHFWIQRRFAVLQKLCGETISEAREMAEIGCGHGLLQRQIEIAYNRAVTGFDLNNCALNQNLSTGSRICCYDILQMDQAFRHKFDLVFLFDVLEHIADEDVFLKALAFHLAPRGKLLINVPAGQLLFSKYDESAGHVRRYSIQTLSESGRRSGLQIEKWSYWGMPLLPILALRKLWLAGMHDRRRIVNSGFGSRTSGINKMLGTISRCEMIPQKLFGTSLMAILHDSNK